MNKKEILEIGKSILTELQKRNGIKINNHDDVVVVLNNKKHFFSTYQLYFSIALALKDFYSIPPDYLGHYLKPVSSSETNRPTCFQIKIIRDIFKDFQPSEILMAGGSFAKTSLKKENNKKVVVKEARGFPSKKLSNELNFHLKFASNPKVAPHLPKVLSSEQKEGFTSMTLRYYPATTLTYKILFGEIKKEVAWESASKVLHFVKEHLWTTEVSPTPEGYINDFFLKRIRKNTELLLKKAPSLAPLVNADEVIINNNTYPNLLNIVDMIEKDHELVELLSPPVVCNIWGDLHPNNILLLENKFILIDTRGNIGDPMYDVGKMYHTFGPGRYDFIDNDLYEVNLRKEPLPVIERRFLTEHPSWSTYNYLGRRFEENIEKFILSQDLFWKLRWDFINFCIYSTMPPFLVKNEPQELRAIMGYSNALIFGKKFLKTKREICLETFSKS